LKPTNRILQIFKKYHARGLFFVDATFLSRLKQENSDCYARVKEQLHEILTSDSDIGLHIHPHWLDAKSIGNCRWTFVKYDKYRLHNLSDIEKKEVIFSSSNLLNEIIYEYDPNYKVETFRAGGWCIQPFRDIRDALKEVGVKYDFSVLPGKKQDKRPRQYYDYTNYPKNKDFWKFDDNVLDEVENGYFIEVPVTMYKMNLYDWMINKKLIKNHKTMGDGKGGVKPMPLLEKLLKVKWLMTRDLSSDSMSFIFFKKYLEKNKHELLTYVAHPKLFSAESFQSLEYICKNYNTVNIRQIVTE